MAKKYELEINAQSGIYEEKERTIKLYFSEPDAGVNKETGLLLLLAGYGGSAISRVYTKMREVFADTYNFVTVQCDYFGYSYMQNNFQADITSEMLEAVLSEAERDLLTRDYEKYVHILQGKIFKQKISLGETKADFNDMGLMQAMDNLRAVKVVLDILKENHYVMNENRIYAYGFSHGAYLAYLCNALWSGLFTGILDNSSYLLPYYLNETRRIESIVEGIQIAQVFEYQAKKYVEDTEILSLPYLYKQVENQAEILCFAGETDCMTALEDKKAFLNQVAHSRVETITKSRVDGEIFKTTEHGLGADFLKLFKLSYEVYFQVKEAEKKKKRQKHQITYENASYETSLFHYEVMWEEGIPVLYRTRK